MSTQKRHHLKNTCLSWLNCVPSPNTIYIYKYIYALDFFLNVFVYDQICLARMRFFFFGKWSRTNIIAFLKFYFQTHFNFHGGANDIFENLCTLSGSCARWCMKVIFVNFLVVLYSMILATMIHLYALCTATYVYTTLLRQQNFSIY